MDQSAPATPAAKKVRVIRADRTGHFAGVMDADALKDYAWSGTEVVVINGVQVDTFEDFMRAVDSSPEAEPEVLFFPPMAGG